MLAVMGYVVADIVRIPGEMYSFAAVPHAVDAHDALLKNGPMYQLLLWIGLFDLLITAPAIGATSAGEREPGGTCIVLFLSGAGMCLLTLFSNLCQLTCLHL